MRREHPEALPFYWIDALCIDQHNTAERNHQVGLMGQIFSRAHHVQIWLGAAKSVIPAARVLVEPHRATLADWSLISSYQKDLERLICQNEYWKRAWIIQEIFLARVVIVWVNSVQLRFDQLHWTIDYFYLSWKDDPIWDFRLFTGRTPNITRDNSAFREAKQIYQGANLITLLTNFREKHCQIPRDRIYSLLSICAGGAGIAIDYDVPEPELALNVLRHCGPIVCGCAPFVVARCLGLWFTTFNPPAWHQRHLESVILKLEFAWDRISIETRIQSAAGRHFLIWHIRSNAGGSHLGPLHGNPCIPIMKIWSMFERICQIVPITDEVYNKLSLSQPPEQIHPSAVQSVVRALDQCDIFWVQPWYESQGVEYQMSPGIGLEEVPRVCFTVRIDVMTLLKQDPGLATFCQPDINAIPSAPKLEYGKWDINNALLTEMSENRFDRAPPDTVIQSGTPRDVPPIKAKYKNWKRHLKKFET